MDPIYIRLNNEQLTLKIAIRAKNVMIRLKGECHDHPNTVYFDRTLGNPKKPWSGKRVFQIPMPISPDLLELYITNELNNDGQIELLGIELDSLVTRDMVISKRTREFVEFAIPFCHEAGYLDEGIYTNKEETIIIGFSNKIVNRDTKKAMSTPARVSRLSGIMEANRLKFRNYTVPMRLLILLHERMHYDFNTKNEIEADLNALRIYLAYGFPQTEAIYATANLFYDSKEMVERVSQIMSFIKDFDQTIKRRAA